MEVFFMIDTTISHIGSSKSWAREEWARFFSQKTQTSTGELQSRSYRRHSPPIQKGF
jgi:hypothetical protein